MTAPRSQSAESDYLCELDATGDVQATLILGAASTLADAKEQLDVQLPALGSYLGRCRIHTLMAVNNNSVVYRGELCDMEIPVAVKVVTPRRAIDRPALVTHLRNEFDVLRRLAHGNVARLWDYKDDLVLPFLATEYADSLTLGQLRQNHDGRLRPKFAVQLILKVLDALIDAWRCGIVHRDVKPENILVLRDGCVKLVDWGLAGWIGMEQPWTNTAERIRFVGTPAYMAPEMAQRVPHFDHRTDIYSLGATLYHIVTGRLPFQARKPTQMILAHLHETPLPPVDFVHEPGLLRLSEIIMRMLAKDPADRYADPEELRIELLQARSEIASGHTRFVRRDER